MEVIPALILSQIRRRLLQRYDDKNAIRNRLMISGVAGGTQALAGFFLECSSVLQTKDEKEDLLSQKRKSYWSALVAHWCKNTISFTILFLAWDKLKSSKALGTRTQQLVQNSAVAILSACVYRIVFWILSGRIPTDTLPGSEGRSGGTPYSLAISQLQSTIKKALFSLIVMDIIFKRPSWD